MPPPRCLRGKFQIRLVRNAQDTRRDSTSLRSVQTCAHREEGRGGGRLATVVFPAAVVNRFGWWRGVTALLGCSGVSGIIVGIASVV
jgi:hypothetical protein